MDNVNYIKHHKNVFSKIGKDEKITSIDISVYNALFLYWNYSNFCETISISRSEVMYLSKVGNNNTYTKSLHRLHELGYIVYIPSKNPTIGSKVTMCRFDTSTGKSSGISAGKSSGTSYGCTNEPSDDTLYKQYNNLTKKQIETLLSHFNDLPKSEISKKISELTKHDLNDENIINIPFDDFWDLYDKKVGEKEKLKNKWNKLKDSERELIIKFIPEYKKSQPDKKYRKNPDTFLNQKSWNDELIQSEQKVEERKFVKIDYSKRIW